MGLLDKTREEMERAKLFFKHAQMTVKNNTITFTSNAGELTKAVVFGGIKFLGAGYGQYIKPQNIEVTKQVLTIELPANTPSVQIISTLLPAPVSEVIILEKKHMPRPVILDGQTSKLEA